MFSRKWQYIAPHRIRAGDLGLPECESGEEIRDLNLQRFARTLEFQGCVAFVGSGPSCALGYPGWNELLPESLLNGDQVGEEYKKLRALIQQSPPAIGYPEAFEIAQNLLTIRNANGETTGRAEIIRHIQNRFQDKRQPPGRNPLPELLELPIRRFITTNYDDELERALKNRLGADYDASKSFAQDDLEKLAIFAVALAPNNRNMVFHCHGVLPTTGRQVNASEQPEHSSPARSTLVLTEEDYKYWYLSDNRVVFTFQRCLEVLLQSNPLFFVGYSLSDSDLVRILRHLSINQVPRSVASNAFVLVRRDSDQFDLWCRGQQIKFGINLIPYNAKHSLAEELKRQRLFSHETRAAWRRQPRAKRPSSQAVTVVQPRPERDFLFESLADDTFLREIDEAVRKHCVVVLLGPAGAGKYVKVSQFVRQSRTTADRFEYFVFSSHGNEDIYAYLKRIVTVLEGADRGSHQTGGASLVTRLTRILDSKSGKTSKKLLLVISGVDLFLDFNESHDAEQPDTLRSEQNVDLENASPASTSKASGSRDSGSKDRRQESHHCHKSAWAPRNRLAAELMNLLAGWSDENKTGNRILLTSRSIPRERKGKIHGIYLRRPGRTEEPFPREQLELNEDEYGKLTWQLQDQHYGLIAAAAYLADFGDATADRKLRLDELTHILSAASSERGTRVVRHIVRALDSSGGRRHELLLTYLSCFNTPIAKEVIDACAEFAASRTGCSEAKDHDALTRRLIKYRLLYAVGPQLTSGGKQAVGTDVPEVNYVVPDIVKRYCRTISAGSQHPEKRACGVHGLLSRGPFNDPGKPKRARELFDYFAKRAFKHVTAMMRRSPSKKSPAVAERARLFTRAALDILRSNFACNSVPKWGSFLEYVDMCSFCLDLVKNLALATGQDEGVWTPGENNLDIYTKENHGTASPEEMIFLYNELGSAYYNEGANQDALSVWGLAFEWQKALAVTDPEQGRMYAASLYSHIGAAEMQMGRMDTAQGHIENAAAAAYGIENLDLSVRMRGMLARIDHFRGNIPDAQQVYEAVATDLGNMGNHRAQSYFMRHWASLQIRLRQFKEAEQTTRASMAIAASENCTDMVAFCRELLAKIYNHIDRPRDAIREYRVTLAEARKLGITRLQADALLGLARVQLGLGDATAARAHAIDALKLANEHLLVLRQIKALVIIGQSAAQLGDSKVAVSCIRHASRLASHSEFRLAGHDAEEALAELRVGPEARGVRRSSGSGA